MKRKDLLIHCIGGCNTEQIAKIGFYFIAFARDMSSGEPGTDPGANPDIHRITRAILDLCKEYDSDVPAPFREFAGGLEEFMFDDIAGLSYDGESNDAVD